MGNRGISRRTLVIGGAAAGVAVVGLGVGEYAEALPGGVRFRRLFGLTGPDGVVPDGPSAVLTTHRFASAARRCQVNLISMTPVGADLGQLPVCLALHGRGSSAQGMVDLGLPQLLAAALHAGVPPFAVVALDGGDSYWIARTPADDPQRMLSAELPGWLTSIGLASATRGLPDRVLGISMGCFGALVYARSRAATPPSRAALLSPALFRDWDEASNVHAFADQAQWAEFEPLQHLSQLPPRLALGVWCGREDPFYPAAGQLAARTRPVVTSFPHGEHDDGFWRRVLPHALSFIGGR